MSSPKDVVQAHQVESETSVVAVEEPPSTTDKEISDAIESSKDVLQEEDSIVPTSDSETKTTLDISDAAHSFKSEEQVNASIEERETIQTDDGTPENVKNDDGASKNNPFDRSQFLKMTSKIHEAFAELKMRKAQQLENDHTIKQLMVCKNDLEMKIGDLQANIDMLQKDKSEMTNTMEIELKRRLQDSQSEKDKSESKLELLEQELIQLKDQIKMTKLDNLNLKMKLEEHDRKTRSQIEQKNTTLEHFSKVEKNHASVKNGMNKLCNYLDELESQMKLITEWQKKLNFINTHQECQLQAKHAANEKLISELMTLQAQNEQLPLEFQSQLNEAKEKINDLESQIAQNEFSLQESKKRFSIMSESKNLCESSLKEALNTIERQNKTNNALKAELSRTSTMNVDLQKKIDDMHQSMAEKDNKIEGLLGQLNIPKCSTETQAVVSTCEVGQQITPSVRESTTQIVVGVKEVEIQATEEVKDKGCQYEGMSVDQCHQTFFLGIDRKIQALPSVKSAQIQAYCPGVHQHVQTDTPPLNSEEIRVKIAMRDIQIQCEDCKSHQSTQTHPLQSLKQNGGTKLCMKTSKKTMENPPTKHEDEMPLKNPNKIDPFEWTDENSSILKGLGKRIHQDVNPYNGSKRVTFAHMDMIKIISPVSTTQESQKDESDTPLFSDDDEEERDIGLKASQMEKIQKML